MRSIVLGFSALVVMLSQLASCFNEPFDRRAMLESLGSDVIIPTYGWFADRTGGLVSSAESFCGKPSASSLESFQEQWRNARDAWKQMEVANFGPYAEQPWRLGPKIDSWPVREDTIEEQLAGDGRLDLEHVSTLGATSRGFPALEYLIFDSDGVSAALLRFEDEGGPRRCEYAIALSEDLRANAEAMVQAWSHEGDDYLGALTASGEPGTPFMSVADASNEMVNRMVFLAENIMRIKLGRPLGLDSGGEARPDQVESRYSDGSIQDILANLDGLE
ncbi:MAG: imelysin family protein, partial [Polyangiales bacterium]